MPKKAFNFNNYVEKMKAAALEKDETSQNLSQPISNGKGKKTSKSKRNRNRKGRK